MGCGRKRDHTTPRAALGPFSGAITMTNRLTRFHSGRASKISPVSQEAIMPTYSLPDLPYDYGALEPFISGRIMELHHDKHHAAYVAGANTALERLAEAREKEGFDNIPALEKA